MKIVKSPPVSGINRCIIGGLMVVMSTSGLFAQESQAALIRRLQEENAALRAQITPTSSAAMQRQSPEEADTIVLSPFEVTTTGDYGYLKTNSLTATRIGARIMDTPLQIQVLSEEFIQDAGLVDLNDVMRYAGTSAGDNAMGVLQPATGFTTSGNISTRGFPINARLRNSVRRYNVYSLDNVERVELIRGPASVFFGQSFPGGVINYVTKQAEFRNIPTSISYRWTTDGGNKATFDQNTVLLEDKVAFRNFVSWENSRFQRDFEFREGFTILPQVKVRISDKLEFRAELEYTKRTENLADQSWIFPQGWFDAYNNPPAALIAVAPAAVRNAADPVAAYRARIANQSTGNYMTDVRNAANDQTIPQWQASSFNKGAAFRNLGGFDYNPYGPGTRSEQEITNIQAVLDFKPLEWLSSRYTWNRAHAYYYEQKAQGRPNADGQTINTLVGLTWRYYDVAPEDHIWDNVITFDLGPTKNKVLFGGIYRAGDNQFGGASPFGPDFSDVPGIDNASPYNLQALKNRAGVALTGRQLFEQYDPSIHPFPNITAITEKTRPLIDRYKPKNTEWYVNYQGAFLEDRLNVMAGYREEKTYNRQQQFAANPPWYNSFGDMLEVLDPSEYAKYQISESYQRSLLTTQSGDSIQYGGTFALTPEVSLYAGYSQSYLPNGGFKAIYDEAQIRQRSAELGRNADNELSRMRAAGSDNEISNEEGTNMEVGIKTALWDNKIVATASLFRLERTNRRVDDVTAQTDDPLNYTASGAYNRYIRWFSADATQRTEGTEVEVIWSPVRNYQLVGSAGWMWTAETVSDPSVAATNVNYDAIFNARLAYAPEYSLNLFNKYSFTEGQLAGFSVGGGMRYRSEIVISNSRDWNPNKGGITAGNYTVFDAIFGYKTELWGINTDLSINVTNLFDKIYYEGGWNFARGREIAFTTRVSF